MYDGICLLLIGFLSVVGIVALVSSPSEPEVGTTAALGMKTWIPAAAGLLLVVSGNYMGKFRRNFFIGIRTPWTLASDEVWLRTHRLGAKTFVIGGLLVTLGACLSLGKAFMVAVIGAAAAIPILYSFVIYRRLNGFGGHTRTAGRKP